MEYVPEVDCSAVVVDLRGNFIHSVKVYVNASHTLIKLCQNQNMKQLCLLPRQRVHHDHLCLCLGFNARSM